MTREEWIAQARALLEGNPEASELLEEPPRPATVVFAEVVEDDAELEQAQAVEVVVPAVPESSPRRRGSTESRALVRAGRFARRALTEPEDRLYGTERLEVKAHQVTERIVDKGMDALERLPGKLPTLRKRGRRFAGRAE